MLGQNLESNVTPENIVISVIQEDVEKISKSKKEEYSAAATLKKYLKQILRVSKGISKGGLGLSSFYFSRLVKKTEPVLEDYASKLDKLIFNIEDAKKNSQIEQLKLISKIEVILKLVQRIIGVLESIRDYNGEVNSPESIDDVHKALDKLKALPDKIRSELKYQHKISRVSARKDAIIAKNGHLLRPMRLYLMSKVNDEARKAIEQRVYFIDEKGLENQLNIILERFKDQRDKFLEEIKVHLENRDRNDGIINNSPEMRLQFLSTLKKQIVWSYTQLSRTIYAFVHDVRNLLDLYHINSKSNLNLNIDLSLDEADNLRELEEIVKILEELPENEVLKRLKSLITDLNKQRQKILVFAKYDFRREEYIDQTAIAEYIKTKRILVPHEAEYKTGFKGTVYSFRFTIPGARGKIRGDIFIKDPNNISEKAVLITPGFLTYRQLYYNLASFLAEDGYTVLVHDIPSQGESRGKYGFEEGSENVLRLILYLKKQYKIKKVGLIGHSLGGVISLFALMNYDTAVDKKVREVAESFAQFWVDLFSKRFYKSPKNVWNIIQTKINSKKDYWEDELRKGIMDTYMGWKKLGVSVECMGILNSPLMEMNKFFRIPKWLMYALLDKKIVPLSLAEMLAQKCKVIMDRERVHETAFERLKKWERIRSEDAAGGAAEERLEHQKRLKELEKMEPIFKKGLTIFDREHFSRASSYGIAPLHYIELIERLFPQALGDIYKIPKMFMFSNDDRVNYSQRNIDLIKIYAEHFKNCSFPVLSGLDHSLTRPGEVMHQHFQADSTFLNYLHHYFKYNL